jgi:two-component system sensor histidine kinase AlgZ
MNNDTTIGQSEIPNYSAGHVANGLLVAALCAAAAVVASRHDVAAEVLWREWVRLSVFAVAIAVAGAVALALFSPVLRKLPARLSAVTAMAILVGTAALVAEMVFLGLPRLPAVDGIAWLQAAEPIPHNLLLVKTVSITALVAVFFVPYNIMRHQVRLAHLSKQSATLQALQSRIRPHFLFNSMNSIAGLLSSDPDRAEKALQDLADVFRVLLADARKLVPIAAEVEVARQYLEIEKIRLGDRLHYVWTNSDVPRAAQIPALTLQPLLENAIYHGVEPSFAGGTVEIEMWVDHDMLNIMISNPLPEVQGKKHEKGNKIAMDNIRQRLTQHFGGRATLQTYERMGQYHAKLRMPILRG